MTEGAADPAASQPAESSALPPCLGEHEATRMMRAAADLTLVVDEADHIESAMAGDSQSGSPSLSGLPGFPGRLLFDMVAAASVDSAAALLREARDIGSGGARDLELILDGTGPIPIRCAAVLLDRPGRVAVLGRDLRGLLALQRQMLTAQQSMDREYGRLREAETRYRILYQVGGDAALVVDTEGWRVVEHNPAAAALIAPAEASLRGTSLLDLVEPRHLPALQGLLGAVEAGSRPSELDLVLRGGAPATLTAHLFRQAGSTLLLARLRSDGGAGDVPRGGAAAPGSRAARMLGFLDAMPEGFVIVGEDQRVLSANAAFCDLTRAAGESRVLGQPLDRWLGRPGVDLPILLSTLREHGSVRSFSTVVRSELGTTEEAIVSAAAALDARTPCIGFAIRTTPARDRIAPTWRRVAPRSPDQLRALVGRSPMREIVRESAEIIERLCIEAALRKSGNNRASAAQLLGLSRQGLYSKLHRYGLSEPDRDN